MAENVESQTFFHVSVAKPYKTVLLLHQSLSVGICNNPFFHFYEGVREYPIAQQDGSLLYIEAIDWLNNVRLGRITPASPAILANIAHEVAEHYVILTRELIMEEMRKEITSEAPSRQRCLYLCENEVHAHYWRDRIGDGGVICSLKCTGILHRADARLLLADSEPLSLTRERARSYWNGEMTESPEREVLFEGDAFVTAVGL